MTLVLLIATPLRFIVFAQENAADHAAMFYLLDKAYPPIFVATLVSLVQFIASGFEKTRGKIHWTFNEKQGA